MKRTINKGKANLILLSLGIIVILFSFGDYASIFVSYFSTICLFLAVIGALALFIIYIIKNFDDILTGIGLILAIIVIILIDTLKIGVSIAFLKRLF